MGAGGFGGSLLEDILLGVTYGGPVAVLGYAGVKNTINYVTGNDKDKPDDKNATPAWVKGGSERR